MGQKYTTCKRTVKNLSASSVDNVMSHVSTLRRTTRPANQQRSVYSAAKPLYLASKLVGLASFECGGKELSKGVTVAYRLFVILCCALHVYGLTIIYKRKVFESPSSKPAKLNFSNILFVFTSFITAIITLINGATMFRRHLPRILFKVSCVDRIFLRYGKGRDIYNRNKMLVTHLVMGFVIATSLYVWDYLLFCANKGYMCSVKLGLRWFASLTNLMMVFQLIFASLLLRQKFKLMNLLLKSWCSKKTREGIFVQNGCETKDLEMLRNMRRVYVLLHEASCLVSAHFGVPILLACTWLFLGTLINLSFIMEMARGWTLDRRNFLQTIFFDMTLAGGCILLLEEISIVCHLTSTEAHLTGVLIQKLLVRHGSVLHAEVERELEFFSCQIERMKVHFSAAGFFLLDVPFFYGIIGVTCTYLTVMAELEPKDG